MELTFSEELDILNLEILRLCKKQNLMMATVSRPLSITLATLKKMNKGKTLDDFRTKFPNLDLDLTDIVNGCKRR